MVNVANRMIEAAARFPARVAIEVIRGDRVETTSGVVSGKRRPETTPEVVSYAALADEAGRRSADLARRGIRHGDRVAILGDNDAAWIAAYFGVLRLGAVPVPLDTAYKAGQIRAVLESSGAALVLTTPRYHDMAQSAAGGLAVAGTAPTVALLADTVGSADLSAPPVANVSGDDVAVLLYTSGTTADPKGVVLTHANLDAERLAVFSVIDVTEDDAVLGVLPLFHALAQVANLLLPLAVGARVVFLESVSSSALLAALQSRGISLLACVPQFFYLIHQRVMSEVARASRLRRALFRTLLALNVRLRERLGWNPGRRWFARVHRVLGPRMRILVTGGSTFDPAIGRDLYGLGFVLLNAYGLTETTGAATIVRPGDRFSASVGQPLPGVEVRTCQDGEILIRGPVVMHEYFNRPDATAEAIRDGWLHTGDLGRLDDAGRLYITGRIKEVIVLSSGKNLYPEELEAHYRQSPFIKELCVLGLRRPGEPAAERVHAVVVLDEGVLRERGIVNVKELVRFEIEGLSVALPAHKRILSYDIWTEALPRTTTGKIRRHEVERRVLAAERTREISATRVPSEAEQRWLREGNRQTSLTAMATRLERQAGVRPDDNLELDLGLDSMERVELLTWLEQRRGTRVAPDVRATIFTVRQLVDAVEAAPDADAASHDAAADEHPWDVVLAGAPDPSVIANLQGSAPVRDAFYLVIIRAVKLLARVILRFRISGADGLPDGACIICPNHQSYLDGFLLCSALPTPILGRVFFVGDAPYFQTPRMRGLADSIHLIPVDPDAHLVSAMQAGAAGLRLGRVLVLFPEGERTIDGEVKRFRKGAAILASHLNVPIVPVALDGLYQLWPRGRPFNWRGLLPWNVARVTLTFGPPVTVGREAATAGTTALQQAVSRMVAEARAGAR